MHIRVWTKSAFTVFSFDRVGMCTGFFDFWFELLLCVWALEEFHIFLLLLDSDFLVRDGNSIDALLWGRMDHVPGSRESLALWVCWPSAFFKTKAQTYWLFANASPITKFSRISWYQETRGVICDAFLLGPRRTPMQSHEFLKFKEQIEHWMSKTGAQNR